MHSNYMNHTQSVLGGILYTIGNGFSSITKEVSFNRDSLTLTGLRYTLSTLLKSCWQLDVA